jgi:hypothetical protein
MRYIPYHLFFKAIFFKHCCFSTVHETNKARVGQITFVQPSTFVRFTQRGVTWQAYSLPMTVEKL